VAGRKNNVALWRPRRIRPNENTFVASAGPIAELHHSGRHLDDDQLAVILAESSEPDLEDEDQAAGDFATFADSASRYLPREQWLPEWRNNEQVLTTLYWPAIDAVARVLLASPAALKFAEVAFIAEAALSHPSRLLITCCGDTAPIDVDMIPICTALWARGVHTQTCCQNQGDGLASQPDGARWAGWAAIWFPDIASADGFAELVTAGGCPPSQTGQWRWELVNRFPLQERGLVIVGIPREHLADVASWLAAAPASATWPTLLVEPWPVDPAAGTVVPRQPPN
jgi:hypothetical protein